VTGTTEAAGWLRAGPESGRSERGWRWRLARADDHAEQTRLFNLCFGKDKDERTFRWKYDDNPHGPALALVAEDDAGRVLGAYSYVPRRFRRDGRPIVLMQASDAMTDVPARGRGVFTGLDDVAAERAGAAGVPWAFAYSGRQSLRGFLGNGWETIGHAPVWRLLFRTRHALRRVRRAGRLLVALAPLTEVLAGWRARRVLTARAGAGLVLERLERFDDRVDALFASTAPARGLVGERDARWLNWRYVDTPTRRQECFGVSEGDALVGYVVVEVHEEHAFLVDHWTGREDVRELLVTAFTRHAHRAGCREATALHFERHPVVATLGRLGYRRSLGRLPFRDTFPFIVRACRADADPRDRRVERWHLTDGDRDAEHVSS